MNFVEAFRSTVETVRVYRMRTVFTLLGTVVGVTFLIAVVTLINGIDRYVRDDLARQLVGLNTVMLTRGGAPGENTDPSRLRALARRPELTLADAEWLAGNMTTPGTLTASAEATLTVRRPGAAGLTGVRVLAATSNHFVAHDLEVADGRLFTPAEAERGLPLAVVGSAVAAALFPHGSAVGETIAVHGTWLRIAGVLPSQGSFLGRSADRILVTPIRSPAGERIAPRGTVTSIGYKVPEAELLPLARAELEGWMRTRRGLRPAEPNDFHVASSDSALELWNRVSRLMLFALPALVSVSLLVGAVVILNISLVSVVERTREIGLRKSLGARPRDILLQFVVESGSLSAAGGAIGIALGVVLAFLVSAFSPLPARVAPWSVGASVALAIGVGVFAGAYPAYRASRLDPIVALRHE